MERVTSLAEVRRQPIPEVVELLKEWLARAKAGEVRSVGIAVDLDNGEVASAYSLNGSRPDLLFAIGKLHHELWGHSPQAGG